jgi:hypothetical protein
MEPVATSENGGAAPMSGTEGVVVTPVAVFGTLAEFHQEPIPYDLAALVGVVSERRPDPLCLNIAPEQWKRGEFGDPPPEYWEALLPLARQTDIVVAPVDGAVSHRIRWPTGGAGASSLF